MFEILTPFESDGRSLFRYLDNIEKQFWNNAGASDAAQFRCDVREQGDCYLLDAELPGFVRNELHIDLTGDQLTIRAQHEGDGAGERYVRRERKTGPFSRSFDVSGIDTARIRAAYNNGILTLTLPKVGQTAPVSQTIDIL